MTPLLAAAAAGPADYWPFAVLGISVALIVLLITVLRVHAFLALILAAFAAGLLAKELPGEPKNSHWVQAVELTTTEFGNTAGKIGVVIALASVIGMCLMESGAADKVVRRFLGLFGQQRAGAAILVSGYILSIPIFFDTFFMLLLPLAVAMRMRTGQDYLLYIMAICCGGTVTHSLVAPHPGPLAMAESLKLDLGLTIMVGVLAGAIPAACSWFVVKWINRRMDVPLREVPGMSHADLRANAERPETELPSFFWSLLPVILPIILISVASTFVAIQGKALARADVKDAPALLSRLQTVRADDQPARWLAGQLSPATRDLLARHNPSQPVSAFLLDAIVADLNNLIRAGVVAGAAELNGVTLRAETTALQSRQPQADNLVRLNRLVLEDAFAGQLHRRFGMNPTLYGLGVFWGNRNIALLLGALLAIFVLVRQKQGLTLARISQLIEPPFATAGVIILITSAGGAFGLMLKNAGVGEAVKSLVEGREVNLLLLSWVVSAIIRVAQGSATVAMLTTAAMIYPIMTGGASLPYHPVYIFMAIGFGAMMLSWMNDSGFWVVGKLSGFTEKETLKSWTVVVSVNSLAGLIVCLVFSKILPMI
jgi:H+/gluconate symporter-like permease